MKKIVKGSILVVMLIWMSQLVLAETINTTIHFNETSQSVVSRSIYVNQIKGINSVSVDTGNVTFNLVDKTIIVQCQNGAVIGYQNDSRSAATFLTSSANSFPTSVYLTQDGYSGNISKSGLAYVISGVYTPVDIKSVSKSIITGTSYPNSTYSYNEGGYSGSLSLSSAVDNGSFAYFTYSQYFSRNQDNIVTSYYDAGGNYINSTYSLGSSMTPTYSINEDGYVGSIPKTSTSLISGPTRYDNQDGSYRVVKIYRGYYNGTLYKNEQEWISNYTGNYQGNVTKPESDTRVWKQNYSGYIYRLYPMYSYNVSVEYEIDRWSPEISNLNISDNQVITQSNGQLYLSFDLVDKDGGDVNANIYVDDNEQASQTVSVSLTKDVASSVLFDAFDVLSLDDGEHTIKVLVEDVANITNEEIKFTLDREAPSFDVSLKSYNEAIEVSVDNIVDANLLEEPIRYSLLKDGILENQSSYTDETKYVFDSLDDNETYSVLVEVEDKASNISTISNVVNTTQKYCDIEILDVRNDGFDIEYLSEDGKIAIYDGTYYYDKLSSKSTSIISLDVLENEVISITSLDDSSSYAFDYMCLNDSNEIVSHDYRLIRTKPLPLTVPNIVKLGSTQNSIDIGSDIDEKIEAYDVFVDGVIEENVKLPYRIEGLNPQTTYAIKIKGKNRHYESDWSSLVNYTTDSGVMGIINGVTFVSDGLDSFIDWNDMPNANSYKIILDGQSYITSLSNYDVTNLDSSIVHYIEIQGLNDDSFSEKSERYYFVLDEQSNSIVKKILAYENAKKLYIDFDDLDNATQYEIDIDGTIYNVTQSSLEGISVLANDSFSISIRAFVNGVWQPFSQAFVFSTKLDQVKNVVLSANSQGIDVSFDPTAGATSYEIYLDNEYCKTITSTSTSIPNVLPGHDYSISVLAKNTSVEGIKSTIATIETDEKTYLFESGIGEKIYIPIIVENVDDIENLTFKLIYDQTMLEIEDLYGVTDLNETLIGIYESEIEIVSIQNGVVMFKVCDDKISDYQYSGFVNEIVFDSLTQGVKTVLIEIE